MHAAEVLREARLAAGITQRDLAHRVDVLQPAIARIESGAVSPRVDTLDRLLAGCDREVGSVARVGAVDPQDWAQVEQNLKRSPAQRLANLESAARSVRRLQDAGRRRRVRR